MSAENTSPELEISFLRVVHEPILYMEIELVIWYFALSPAAAKDNDIYLNE